MITEELRALPMIAGSIFTPQPIKFAPDIQPALVVFQRVILDGCCLEQKFYGFIHSILLHHGSKLGRFKVRVS